jgi:hypothetical protein
MLSADELRSHDWVPTLKDPDAELRRYVTRFFELAPDHTLSSIGEIMGCSHSKAHNVLRRNLYADVAVPAHLVKAAEQALNTRRVAGRPAKMLDAQQVRCAFRVVLGCTTADAAKLIGCEAKYLHLIISRRIRKSVVIDPEVGPPVVLAAQEAVRNRRGSPNSRKTFKEVDQIFKQVAAGGSTNAVAADLGCTAHSIRDIIGRKAAYVRRMSIDPELVTQAQQALRRKPAINHKQLLCKLVQHVAQIEGLAHVGMRYASDVEFSDAEWAELERVSK